MKEITFLLKNYAFRATEKSISFCKILLCSLTYIKTRGLKLFVPSTHQLLPFIAFLNDGRNEQTIGLPNKGLSGYHSGIPVYD